MALRKVCSRHAILVCVGLGSKDSCLEFDSLCKWVLVYVNH